MPHKYLAPDLGDHSIYGIFKAGVIPTIMYVGQTTVDRDGARFYEHAKNDDWAPWYFEYVLYDEFDDSSWPYFPRNLWVGKQITCLECAAAEQYYWEQNGGLTGDLANRIQPLKFDTFNRYKNSDTWRPTQIGFHPSWCPTDRPELFE